MIGKITGCILFIKYCIVYFSWNSKKWFSKSLIIAVKIVNHFYRLRLIILLLIKKIIKYIKINTDLMEINPNFIFNIMKVII